MEDSLMTFLVGRNYQFRVIDSNETAVGRVEKIYQKKNSKWFIKFLVKNGGRTEVSVSQLESALGPVQ